MHAITHSSWINAWTLYHACKKLGLKLYTTDLTPRLPLPIAPPGFTSNIHFFTEEQSLKKYLGSTAQFYPKHMPLELIDDKLQFAEWLQSINELPVPFLRVSEDIAEFPVLLKPRYSWLNGEKLPRGWLCFSQSELEYILMSLKNNKLSACDFYLQKWLGDIPVDIISVCGFFSCDAPQRNHMTVVKRVLPHQAQGPSGSAIVATVHDDDCLIARCEKILGALNFTGPFELEFIRTTEGCYVLELNPRFWMQHGLFLANDNSLVKRYLDLDVEADWQNKPPQHLLWVDGAWFLKQLFQMKCAHLITILGWRFKSYKVIFFPSLLTSFRYHLSGLFCTLSNKLLRTVCK
jgi:hypothetical protein